MIAYNDLLAIGLMRGLQSLGVRIPDDVSIVGFDNIFGADFCTPQLTTIAAPLRQLGAVAVQTVLDDLAGTLRVPRSSPNGALKTALLPARLVVRASTAAANADARWPGEAQRALTEASRI